MENAIVEYYGMATVTFTDHGRTWTERGRLRRRKDGLFVLDQIREGGDRVFPLSNRRAEVYLDMSTTDKPWVIE